MLTVTSSDSDPDLSGLAAHTPLGAINQLRKPVYRELAIRRHNLNGVSPADTSELPQSRTSARVT